MLIAAICAVAALLTAGWLSNRKPPLDGDELARLRRLSDEIHREAVLPFD